MSALNEVYTIWCEWDIGQNGRFYTSKEEALKAAKSLFEQQGFESTFEEVLSEHLIGVESLKHG